MGGKAPMTRTHNERIAVLFLELATTHFEFAKELAADLRDMTGRRWEAVPSTITGQWIIGLPLTSAADLRGDLAEGRTL